jgi:hypothetical protein
MKFLITITFLIISAISALAQPPNLSWAQNYGRVNTYEYGQVVLQNPDSSYTIAGSMGTQVLLMKASPTGQVQWYRL